MAQKVNLEMEKIKMDKFRYDPVNNPPLTAREAEWQRFYFLSLIQSLEAKLTRIEPLSDEFEETMNLIYDAQRARDQAAYNYLALHYEKATREFDEPKR